MSIDGRSDRVHNICGDAVSLREVANLLLVLISQLNDVLITLALDVVGLYKCLEDWESVPDILDVVESVDVDTSDFYFITRSCTVDQVSEAGHFFLAGDTARRDCTWGLLHGEFLIVFVDSELLIKRVWTILVAQDTFTQVLFALKDRVVVGRAL